MAVTPAVQQREKYWGIMPDDSIMERREPRMQRTECAPDQHIIDHQTSLAHALFSCRVPWLRHSMAATKCMESQSTGTEVGKQILDLVAAINEAKTKRQDECNVRSSA